MTLLGILVKPKLTVIGADSGSAGVGSFVDGFASSLLSATGSRLTKGIVIDCTISESHTYESEITKNPVEDGATITDHVQPMPPKLTIEGIIADYPLGFAVISNAINAVRAVNNFIGQSSRKIDGFNGLIELRDSGEPFTVITGLKKYDNMVFSSLDFPRDSNTGNVLRFTATLEQITIVKSETSSNLGDEVAKTAGSTKSKGRKGPTISDDFKQYSPTVGNYLDGLFS